MEDFWNTSETTPAALDNFFDEESDVPWTGYTQKESLQQKFSKHHEKTISESHTSASSQNVSSANLTSTSIVDNISIHSEPGATSAGSQFPSKSRGVKALGDKIEAWKPSSVSIKWKNSGGSGSCLQCVAKDDEITQLKLRLERAYSRQNVTLSPDETVHRMILGQPFMLENYKTLEDKLLLLEASIKSLDSSTLLAVVIFMKKTLSKTLFMQELRTRPQACQVYVNYLKQRSANIEALELLMSLGRMEEAAMLKYHLATMTKNTETRMLNLKQAYDTSFQDSKLSFEAKLVKQHIHLLELQVPLDAADAKDQSNPVFVLHPRATSLIDLPLLTTLYYCSMYHWSAPENLSKSPLSVRKIFFITDRQFLWTVLRARARVKHWPLPSDLENLLASKGIISTLSSLGGFSGSGKTVKNALPLDRVVDTLATTEAPSNVLAAYISLLESNEEKLRVGMTYKCHEAVIEAYVNLRNREALESYMKSLTFGSADYVKAEQALKNTKWKS